MSVDYTAILFYGFGLPEEFEDQLEEFDYDWEDWLANKLGVKCYSPEYKKAVEDLGATIVDVEFYDKRIFFVVVKNSYHSACFNDVLVLKQKNEKLREVIKFMLESLDEDADVWDFVLPQAKEMLKDI